MEIPFDILPEIAKHTWQAWRILQQCSKKLFDAIAHIDPYSFTTVEVLDDDVDEPRFAWKDKDGTIFKVFIASNCGFFMIFYRDGRNYEYDSHFVMWRPPFHEGWRPIFVDSISTRSLIITKPGPIDVWEIYYSFLGRGETNVARPVEMGALEAEAYDAFVKRGNLKIVRTDHNPDDESVKKIIRELGENQELNKKFRLLSVALQYT